jgi:geranylgeranyl pyrophosphate synthase
MLYTTIDPNHRQNHFANAAQIIKAPSDYISSLPSKGMRNTAIDALNVWYDVSPRFTAHISSVLHGLHTSSLMLDDIEDDSPLRRGKPTTHCVFGAAQTINSANFQFVETLEVVRKQLGPECLVVYAEELRLLHVGQSLDLHWTSQVKCPSMAEYMKMIDCSESGVMISSNSTSQLTENAETGGLFRMLSRMLEAKSAAKP